MNITLTQIPENVLILFWTFILLKDYPWILTFSLDTCESRFVADLLAFISIINISYHYIAEMYSYISISIKISISAALKNYINVTVLLSANKLDIIRWVTDW